MKITSGKAQKCIFQSDEVAPYLVFLGVIHKLHRPKIVLVKKCAFQDKPYDVFLSYSHEDEAWVEQVDSNLILEELDSRIG